MKNKILLLWIFLGIITYNLAFYLIINNVIEKIQIKQQIDFSYKILNHAEAVTNQIISSTNSALKINSCDDKNIEKLRNILLTYSYLDDIGIVKDGKIICTANRGVLKYKITLPSANYINTLNYKFYKNFNSKNFLKKPSDITQFKNVIVVTSIFAFDKFEYLPPNFNYELAPKNRKYIFQSSYINKKNTNPLNSFIHKNLSTKVCSNKYSYCVFADNPYSGLFLFKSTVFFIIFIFTSITGGLLTYFTFIYKNHLSSIEHKLKKAISKGKLYMEYQPILRANDKSIVGFEALIRWKDDLYGQVSPDVIISLAENNNFYNVLSGFIFEKTLKDFNKILLNNRELSLSLNINNHEINDNNFIANLSTKVNNLNILTKQLKLEITEKIDNSSDFLNFIKEAKEAGFKISIDDFGTGISNIERLIQIDFDEIKLDKIFIKGLNNDNDIFLISLLNGLIKLNKNLVFEGVEYESEYLYIYNLIGNNYIQGWYFYKSLSIKEINKLIRYN
ncbi:EAL domain-containing protein [uncultured Acinetobacter sp.]|uniref:EAL domain-containing protein n=1 Tax=uncultured Acinetobacter sp. TaxID=165433 RepID=UPI00258517B1|nr:EAL domain-containing protein [uncultured Acinetobacter sp.]